jgi:hypothetical protein
MNRRKSELNNRRKTGEGEIKEGRKTCEWTGKWANELNDYTNAYLSAYLFCVSAVRTTVLRNRQLAMFVGCQHHHNCWSGFLVNDTLDQCSSYSFQPPFPTTERNLLRDERNNQVSTCHWHEPRICCASVLGFTINHLPLIYFLESCTVSMIVSWIVLIQRCWICGSTSLITRSWGM